MTDKLLRLHVPEFNELDYRRKILSDPETMSYNAGYNLDFDGYDNETGCIDFPESEWADWYGYFVNSGERFYAYIETDGEFIGEVNLHGASESNFYNMGIVIEAKHRKKGYAEASLKLLLKQAFEVMGAEAVINEFEAERISAVRTHLKAGFEVVDSNDGITVYKITRRKYFADKD